MLMIEDCVASLKIEVLILLPKWSADVDWSPWAGAYSFSLRSSSGILAIRALCGTCYA